LLEALLVGELGAEMEPRRPVRLTTRSGRVGPSARIGESRKSELKKSRLLSEASESRCGSIGEIGSMLVVRGGEWRVSGKRGNNVKRSDQQQSHTILRLYAKSLLLFIAHCSRFKQKIIRKNRNDRPTEQ
jgi:hypothetical protein